MASNIATSSLPFPVDDQQTAKPDYNIFSMTSAPEGAHSHTSQGVQAAGITGNDRFTVSYQNGDSGWNVRAESAVATSMTLLNMGTNMPPALGQTQLNAEEAGALQPVIAANWH